MRGMPTYPFEVSFGELQANTDAYVDCVFSSLESEFLVMPKGTGFVDYPLFEQGYESLKRATSGFCTIETEAVYSAVVSRPVSLIVLRSMLGFTPPEWAYVTSQRGTCAVSQGFARSWDRRVRLSPLTPLRPSAATSERLRALVSTACQMLREGAPPVTEQNVHRLGKADTASGGTSLAAAAAMGVPYPMLLYERFLGRPFACHRDSVSELVGGNLELAIEDALAKAAISFRKTGRAERIAGFDQAPDFIVPDEFAPRVIIEAKVTEDDGTARDKATRIQHLAEIARSGGQGGEPRFEVVACIGGRGFGVRRSDMAKIILATRGKVFTLRTLRMMVENTALCAFRCKPGRSPLT